MAEAEATSGGAIAGSSGGSSAAAGPPPVLQLAVGDEELRLVFDRLHEGLFFADEEGCIVDANAAACRQLGYDRTELVGLRIADISARPGFDFAAVRGSLGADGHSSYVTRHRRKDGSVYPVELSVTAARFRGAWRMVGVARDLTERQDRQAELERKNDELTRFTYAVSHDLRSPLVTIQSFVGFLVQDIASGDAARIERDLVYIRTAADKMSHLLDELLQLSRVGRQAPVLETVLASEVVDEARALVAGRVETSGASVVVDLPPLQMLADRARMVEVFQNLLDNAVKFAAGLEEPPRIRIGARSQGAEWVVFVEDNGRGVDPRHEHKLFGLFEKLHPDLDGAGVGLALVRRIVEIHSGRVWIESGGPGRGARACVSLPGLRLSSEAPGPTPGPAGR